MSITFWTVINSLQPNKPAEQDWEGLESWMTGMMIYNQDLQRNISLDLGLVNDSLDSLDTRLDTAEADIDALELQLRRSFLL